MRATNRLVRRVALLVLTLGASGGAAAAASWEDCGNRDPDRSIAGCSQALILNPGLPAAYFARAQAREAKGEHDRAIADYDAAVRLDPAYADAYVNRGLAYANKGDLARALADARKGLTLRPGDADTLAAVQHLEQRLSRQEAPVVSPPSVPVPGPKVASLPVPVDPPAAPNEKRIALVIGNSHYASIGLLANPGNDARDIGKALEANGFSVTSRSDLTREQTVDALARFASEAETADWAVVYYSGHGIEIAGVNYLIPVDARLPTDSSVQFEAVPLGQVMGAVDGARKLRLVILDACRANPFASRMRVASASRAPSRGLARPPEPDPGELIVYAARDGEVASDGDGIHSPFTAALLKEMDASHVDVRRLFDLVRDDVIDATGGHQHPFTYGSLSGRQDFLFSAE